MNHTLLRLVIFALFQQDESKAVRMLRRRKIIPDDGDANVVDVAQWQTCTTHLQSYCLPWFVPRFLARVLPAGVSCRLSSIGFSSHLDNLDHAYYANNGHGTAGIDFIIQTIDTITLSHGPPPLRRSCTGWYPSTCADVSMTAVERDWLNQHSNGVLP